jgi:hypothetical protein
MPTTRPKEDNQASPTKEAGYATAAEQGGKPLKPALTLPVLLDEARRFAEIESSYPEPVLFGVDNGKAIGTYFEHKFRAHLLNQYAFGHGNSARGIDFPELDVDMKTTSINQPQSSCPYKAARQKIFGLGYCLIVFVYQKTDDPTTRTGVLDILHTIYVEKHRTADFQMTTGLRQIIENKGNEDDIVAFIQDKNLPVDEIEARAIAEELLSGAPLEEGYLTISNALQWRLQYSRVIAEAGRVEGLLRVR